MDEMNEMLPSNEMTTFIEALEGLVDIEDEIIEQPEVMETLMNYINNALNPLVMQQSANQIIQNLEMQNATKADALESMSMFKQLLNEKVYGEHEFTGNKKILIDKVMNSTFQVFEMAIEKYHAYAIELPMIVDTADGAKVPTYAHETDAAADLYAMEDVHIQAFSHGNKIRTGVKIQLPEGWLALIIPRSSIGAKTPLRLSNSVGLIDSGYRGELGVLYDNISDVPYDIHAGDRIAQLLVMPSYRFQAKVVDILADSDRGEDGFGSSGN